MRCLLAKTFGALSASAYVLPRIR